MLFDYHKNNLEIETQGVAIGADRWAIVATYCYIRRFYPSAWLLEVEFFEADKIYAIAWRETLDGKDEYYTQISKLWSKRTLEQPDPITQESDAWIIMLEKQDAEQQARNAKHRKKEGNNKQKTQDVMLSDNQAPVISFKRESKPEPEPKSEYETMLENLF